VTGAARRLELIPGIAMLVGITRETAEPKL